MGLRDDYRRIGDLVELCACTMRMLSQEKRKQGVDCPFRLASYRLEELSEEIRDLAAALPSDWDHEARGGLH